MSNRRRLSPEKMTRDASLGDAAAAAAIYNKCVLESTATFETDPLSDAQMRARMAEIIGRGFPYIAGEIGGEFAGFACAHPWRERSAYERTLETSVYVAEKFRGQGLGSELLGGLLERCEKLPNAHALVACITSENLSSVRLHEKFGFRRVSDFREVGFKFGRYLGVSDFELLLPRGSAR